MTDSEQKTDRGRAGRLAASVARTELAVCEQAGLPAEETRRRLRARYRAMVQSIKTSKGKRWQLPWVSRSTWYRMLRQVAGHGVREIKAFRDRRQLPLFG